MHVAIHTGHLHGGMKGTLLALNRAHQLLHRRPVADVALVGDRCGADRADRLGAFLARAHVGHRELETVAREPQGHIGAHAASGTRDERHPGRRVVHGPGSGDVSRSGSAWRGDGGGAVSEASRPSSQQASLSHSTATGSSTA